MELVPLRGAVIDDDETTFLVLSVTKDDENPLVLTLPRGSASREGRWEWIPWAPCQTHAESSDLEDRSEEDPPVGYGAGWQEVGAQHQSQARARARSAGQRPGLPGDGAEPSPSAPTLGDLAARLAALEGRLSLVATRVDTSLTFLGARLRETGARLVTSPRASASSSESGLTKPSNP